MINKDLKIVAEKSWLLVNELTMSFTKRLLNGFLLRGRDMINAPNGRRKATSCISSHIRKKENFIKILEFFQIFSKYFLGKTYKPRFL